MYCEFCSIWFPPGDRHTCVNLDGYLVNYDWCESCNRWHASLTDPLGVRIGSSAYERNGYVSAGELSLARMFTDHLLASNTRTDAQQAYADNRFTHDLFGNPEVVVDYENYADEDDEEHYPDDDDYYGDDSGSEYLMNYSYRPLPRFRGIGPIFLGIEVELEAVSSGQRNEAAAMLASCVPNDRAYMKEDGSLYRGLEFVTHPFSYMWHKRYFGWERVCKTFQDEGLFAQENTGIHVHVSRSGFDNRSHVYRWLNLIYRNPELVQHVARRGSVEYSTWPRTASGQTRHKETRKVIAKEGTNAANVTALNRYDVINAQNPTTFEVRAFASSTDPNEIMAALGLVDASVRYTKGLRSPDVINGGWTGQAFTDYVGSHSRYAPLRDVLKEVTL